MHRSFSLSSSRVPEGYRAPRKKVACISAAVYKVLSVWPTSAVSFRERGNFDRTDDDCHWGGREGIFTCTIVAFFRKRKRAGMQSRRAGTMAECVASNVNSPVHCPVLCLMLYYI